MLGGARSGKSRHAEHLAMASGLAPVYLATAQALDDEMARRIAAHRARRGPAWRTVEEPLDLVGALQRECAPERIVLVDCLTLWLTNLMVAGRDGRGGRRAAARGAAGAVGAGAAGVERGRPGHRAGQRHGPTFVDHAGFLHQGIAEQADAVVFMTAGLPHRLK